LDTSILGTVRLHITLAPNSVLIKDTYGAGIATYSLRKNYFTVDTISLNDGVYYSVVNARLSDPENPIEIPFQTWTHFSKGVGSLDGQTQATLSTESLDMLVGTYQQSNLADNVNVANLNAYHSSALVLQTLLVLASPLTMCHILHSSRNHAMPSKAPFKHSTYPKMY
jgi:hypothetical protein